jgi:hypothetical protein
MCLANKLISRMHKAALIHSFACLDDDDIVVELDRTIILVRAVFAIA